MGPSQRQPAGLLAACVFFALAGVLELGMSLWELPRPWPFWPAWEALGRALLHALLAWGLWRRLALCRTIALVYCLAAVVLYAVVLGLALGQAPLRFPPSLVIQSLYQVPSCVLLFAYLRSPRAGTVFTRPLFG
jgi:hypothetical protein